MKKDCKSRDKLEEHPECEEICSTTDVLKARHRSRAQQRIEKRRPNYLKLSYNRIKLPIIGDCIA